MSALWRLLRNHLHALLICLVLTIVMTWPTAVYVFDTEIFWLPTNNRDVWMQIWHAWHGGRVLAGSSAVNMTEMLFYPVGMSLDLHLYNVFHMALLFLLQSLVPVANAYSLLYLLIIISSVLSAYCFLMYFFKDKWLALFGAVAIGFSQHVIDHPMHVGLAQLFTLPLSIYAFFRGVQESNVRWIATSGVLVGMTIYVNPYTFMIVALTMGMVMLYFMLSLWRNLKFWMHITLLGVVALIVAFARLYPMLQDPAAIEDALNKNAGRETGNDLIASFVNYRNPLTTPFFLDAFGIETEGVLLVNGWKHTSYLGYLPIALVLIGLSRAKYRRKMWPWLLILLPFFLLRLGSELRINDVIYSNVLLPKYYLDAAFPAVFEAVHETDHFQMGVLLPLAVLACFGLKVILDALPDRIHVSFILLCIALLAFEYYTSLEGRVLYRRNIKFNNWFLQQDNQDSIRLINLPMGRDHAKVYSFYQTLNGYPHAEGVTNRTPQASYRFIRRNELLSAWAAKASIRCNPTNPAKYMSALDELLAVGFTHVVLHVREAGADQLRPSFGYIMPAYQDSFAEIYHISDLLDHCVDLTMWLEAAPAHLKAFVQYYAGEGRPDVSVLSLHPGDSLSEQERRFHAILLDSWKTLIHVIENEQRELILASSTTQEGQYVEFAANNHLIWIIYDPQQIAPRNSRAYSEVLAGKLKSCEQIRKADHLAIDTHIDRDFPCALISDPDPLAVRYDNGIKLANILHNVEGELLTWYLWWSDEPVPDFAFSIQLSNDSGAKVMQLDDVIRNEPLSRHEMDISNLPPGQYRADLIVYGSETGKSQPGTILSAGDQFPRTLEVARIAVES